jgi:hypothetical protein
MSALCLVTGTIAKNPEQRTSRNGNTFVAVSIKVRDGDTTQWWKAMAFGTDAQAQLTYLMATRSAYRALWRLKFISRMAARRARILHASSSKSCRSARRRSRKNQS